MRNMSVDRAASLGIDGKTVAVYLDMLVDLLLTPPGGALWAIEVKRSMAPTLERSFHQACADLKPERRIAIYPGSESYPLREGIEVMPLQVANTVLDEVGRI